MADAPKPKGKTSSPKGRVVMYSVLGIGGLAVAYYQYTRYQANNAATGTTSGTPTTAGDTTGTTQTAAGPAASTTTPITTVAQWKTAVLNYMVHTAKIKGGANVAATGLERALSGHCVGPNEYSALNAALGAVGQPPGNGLLTLQQCKTAPKVTTTHTPSETPKKKAPVAHPIRPKVPGTPRRPTFGQAVSALDRYKILPVKKG